MLAPVPSWELSARPTDATWTITTTLNFMASSTSSPINLSSPLPETLNETVPETFDDDEGVLHMGSPVEETLPEDLEAMDVDGEVPEAREQAESVDGNVAKKIGTKKASETVEREPGKSLLPHSRVQKIIKADKDIPIVAKDATFLISLATEEFIRRISEASAKAAKRENRSTVQGRDLVSVVRRVDEFLFLEDILPFMTAEPKRTSKLKQALTTEPSALKAAPTFMDQFVSKSGQQPAEEQTDSTTLVAGWGDGASDS